MDGTGQLARMRMSEDRGHNSVTGPDVTVCHSPLSLVVSHFHSLPGLLTVRYVVLGSFPPSQIYLSSRSE